MDVAIAAAWIGAGVGGGVALVGVIGTVVTSVVNSNNTRKATERTVQAGTEANRATLVAAREDRLWERRRAAYEETLALVRFRSERRQHELSGYRMDAESEERSEAYFATYERPNAFEAQSRMTAYASSAVLDAYEASFKATGRVVLLHGEYLRQAQDNQRAVASGSPGSAVSAETMIGLRRAVNPAVGEAEAADEALVKLIRDELHSKPEAALPTPVLPPSGRPARRWVPGRALR